MNKQSRLSITVFFAFFCIVGGAVKPAYSVLAALQTDLAIDFQQLPDDLSDGTEEGRDQDENDDDIDPFKLIRQRISLDESDAIVQQWFIHYHRLFKTHIPELTTPPPRE